MYRIWNVDETNIANVSTVMTEFRNIIPENTFVKVRPEEFPLPTPSICLNVFPSRLKLMFMMLEKE